MESNRLELQKGYCRLNSNHNYKKGHRMLSGGPFHSLFKKTTLHSSRIFHEYERVMGKTSKAQDDVLLPQYLDNTYIGSFRFTPKVKNFHFLTSTKGTYRIPEKTNLKDLI